MERLTTYRSACRYYRMHKGDRRLIRGQFLSGYDAILREYPKMDPWGVIDEMSLDEYLKSVDAETAEGDDDDE